MKLIVVLNTLEALTPLLPDFAADKVIRCERMWQFSPTVKEWMDAHPERKEDVEQVYNQLTEDEQLLYRSFELELQEDIDTKLLNNYLMKYGNVLAVEIG